MSGFLMAFYSCLTRKNGLEKLRKKITQQVGNQLIRFSQSCYHVHTHKGFKYVFCYECPAGSCELQKILSSRK